MSTDPPIRIVVADDHPVVRGGLVAMLRRMHRAAHYLRVERLGVLEVAHRVGYRSTATFSKTFKRNTGLSPGAYRRSAGDPAGSRNDTELAAPTG